MFMSTLYYQKNLFYTTLVNEGGAIQFVRIVNFHEKFKIYGILHLNSVIEGSVFYEEYGYEIQGNFRFKKSECELKGFEIEWIMGTVTFIDNSAETLQILNHVRDSMLKEKQDKVAEKMMEDHLNTQKKLKLEKFHIKFEEGKIDKIKAKFGTHISIDLKSDKTTGKFKGKITDSLTNQTIKKENFGNGKSYFPTQTEGDDSPIYHLYWHGKEFDPESIILMRKDKIVSNPSLDCQVFIGEVFYLETSKLSKKGIFEFKFGESIKMLRGEVKNGLTGENRIYSLVQNKVVQQEVASIGALGREAQQKITFQKFMTTYKYDGDHFNVSIENMDLKQDTIADEFVFSSLKNPEFEIQVKDYMTIRRKRSYKEVKWNGKVRDVSFSPKFKALAKNFFRKVGPSICSEFSLTQIKINNLRVWVDMTFKNDFRICVIPERTSTRQTNPGILFKQDGTVCMGLVKNFHLCGEGIKLYPESSSLNYEEGWFQMDFLNVQGVRFYKDQVSYNGGFKLNLMNGYGLTLESPEKESAHMKAQATFYKSKKVKKAKQLRIHFEE
jgi:hypothetical protein